MIGDRDFFLGMTDQGLIHPFIFLKIFLPPPPATFERISLVSSWIVELCCLVVGTAGSKVETDYWDAL